MSSPTPDLNWWSGQFIDMLVTLGLGEGLPGGRRAARSGHVRELTISSSLATALVRGTEDRTFRARIGVRAFSPGEWARVERELARQAIHPALLLAGRMPSDIADVLDGLGLRLFPDNLRDVAMDCSCPGWEVPCRHLAAACWALAESFDADPFGILAWRGRSRDEFLDRLKVLRTGTPDRTGRHPEGALPSHSTPPTPSTRPTPPALADCLDSFWTVGGPVSANRPQPVAVGVRRPDALLDQLDPLPLTLDGVRVTDLLRPLYRAITETGERPR